MGTAPVYDQPDYYEIAFGFRDIAHEVGVMEECITRFARRPVRRVAELACGNSPHMIEWARRGYEYTGLDLNPAMVLYSREKAQAAGIDATVRRGDMVLFNLKPAADFVYVLLGSLYVVSTQQLRDHLDSVARNLDTGGLYFLDWVIDFDPLCDYAETWEEERDGVHVRATCMTHHVNRVDQTSQEHIILEVTQNGETKTYEQRTLKRLIYPQEFLMLVNAHPHLEFVGWWDEWDLDRPVTGTESTRRAATLLRRC